MGNQGGKHWLKRPLRCFPLKGPRGAAIEVSMARLPSRERSDGDGYKVWEGGHLRERRGKPAVLVHVDP